MNSLSLSCGVILAVLFFSLTDATWYTVLKVGSGSGISVFSLWNFTGAHCDKSDLLYRNNYMENLSNPCINDINLMFVDSNSDTFQIKYIRPFPDFYLETILSVVPNFVDGWTGPLSSTDHYLIRTSSSETRYGANDDETTTYNNTDSFEYLWINNAETRMYAGAYYNVTDPNSPKFVFSYGGVNYSPGMTSSQLVSDRPVKYLEVIVNIQTPCEHLFSEPVDDSLCLGPEVYITGIHGNTKEVENGTKTNLTCTMISQLPILGVNWTRDGNVLLDEQNPTKYQGTHTLLIDSFQLDDSGNYTCTAVTAMGSGMSQPIHVKFIAVPTVSVNQTNILINASNSLTLHCSASATPAVTNVKWYKDVGGTVTVISMSPAAPSLTFASIKSSDKGNYKCSAFNAVGQTNSSVIIVDVNEGVKMCPCSCDYKQRLDYWATKVVPNYTTEEWREVLAPITAEIRKNLTVDKTNLSSTIRALTSASDERTSSKSLGLLGIVLISLTFGAFVTMDITSIKRHLTAMKEYLHHDKVIE